MESLLLSLGFMAIAVVLLTPFKKSGAFISLISFLTYFISIGISSVVPILLFTVGLSLILFEILIPDFGLVGILGILSLLFGLYQTVGDLLSLVLDLSISVILTAILVYLLIQKGYSLNSTERLVLNTASKQPHDNEKNLTKQTFYLGQVGTSQTPLRPAGKVTFHDKNITVDVLSAQGHIEAGIEVEVEKITGSKIMVKRI